ncbi:MAG: hypothetical protein K2H98_05780, partial [Duncaniella sp.]|nr:hypothetical protein [Duncaniella sp.]
VVYKRQDSVDVIHVRNSTVRIGGLSITFTDTVPDSYCPIDNLLILTRGFRSHYITDSTVLPDTVYISPCLNDKIAGKVITKLTERGVVAVNLKEKGLVIKR